MTLSATGPRGRVRMTHFGAANWRLTDGRSTVWVDPYFTRLKSERHAGFGPLPEFTLEGDDRPTYGVDDAIDTDHATVDAHVGEADYLLLSHSHLNHCMDAPYIAMRTGATIIGSASTAAIARAAGVPDEQIITVRGGEDFAFDHGLSVRVVPSLHSPLNAKHFFEDGRIPDGLAWPLRVRDFIEGGTYAYLIRLAGHEILAFGSMNFIENELRGIKPTCVLVAAAPPRKHIHRYTERLLSVLDHPGTVVATHWDRQALPFGAPQDVAWQEGLEFIDEVRAVAPDADAHLPRHFDSIELDDGGSRLIAGLS